MYKVSTGSILSGVTREAEVDELHQGIEDNLRGFTFKEILTSGKSWSREKILLMKKERKLEAMFDFLTKWDYDKNPDAISKIGKFNGREIPAAKSIARFLQTNLINLTNIQDMELMEKVLGKKKISLKDLTTLSVKAAEFTAVAYVIKMYIIANYSEDDLHYYWGVLPQTGPVKLVIKKVFQEKFSQYEQSLFCNMLGQEHEQSGMYINSALWLMGKELKTL